MVSIEMARKRARLTGRDEGEAESDAMARIARISRADLLSMADVSINRLEDAGADTSAWRAYRQALRDVPQQAGFPASINWPTAPGIQE